MQITFSKDNIRKQSGGGILSAVLPALRAVAPALSKTLGLSALAGGASEGVSQIIKKMSGGQIFQVPNDKLFNSDMDSRVTGKQVRNGVGTLLASIRIPLAIEAVKKLTGRGIRGGSSMRIGKGSPRIGRPPPFIGSWEGRGKMNKKRIGSLTRQKKSLQGTPP